MRMEYGRKIKETDKADLTEYEEGGAEMSKKLSEMRLEELWQLFPIYLTEHNESWAEWYIEEETTLKHYLPADQLKRISHIGSTAVKGIWAKPIIDILVEVTPENDLQQIKPILEKVGYLCMSENPARLSFNKGYTESGFAERVFHLHLRKAGDNDELYFRDYLNTHSDVAKEYEKLKLSLWKQYEHNRDAYTESKTAFVKEYTQEAKAEYKNLYSDIVS